MAEKIAPHSLRKMFVQALYDHISALGLLPDTPMGEIIGWFNRESTTRAFYAQLSMEGVLEIVSTLNPATLPVSIATVAVPPIFYSETAEAVADSLALEE